MLRTSLPRCVIALGGHCTVAQLCRYGKLSILVEPASANLLEVHFMALANAAFVHLPIESAFTL
jgi:hypothetical protein